MQAGKEKNNPSIRVSTNGVQGRGGLMLYFFFYVPRIYIFFTKSFIFFTIVYVRHTHFIWFYCITSGTCQKRLVIYAYAVKKNEFIHEVNSKHPIHGGMLYKKIFFCIWIWKENDGIYNLNRYIAVSNRKKIVCYIIFILHRCL